MLRLILLVLIAALYLILTLPVLGILALIGRKNPEKRQRISQKMVQWIFRVLLFAGGVRVTATGLENIPSGCGALYVGNHRSIFDILVTYSRLPVPTGIISKDSVKKIPILPWWMNAIGCLFLDRSDVKAGLRMLQSGIEQINNGSSILIYPEGTRNKGETELPLLEFHEGSFRLATKTGCPVIPVAVSHTAEIFEAQKPLIRSGNVTLSFGTPVDTASLSRDEKKHLGAYTRDIITRMLETQSDETGQ